MNTARTTYAIRVNGHLDHHWSRWLGESDITHDEDGTTTLTVSIADQAQLHGVLAGLRDIGAVITELRSLPASPPPSSSPCGQSVAVAQSRRLPRPRRPRS